MLRILLVEDNVDLSQGIAKALTIEGFIVDAVYNGKDAIHCQVSETYNLVILDLGLPDIDGIKVLKEIRHQDKALPVLILTARDSLESKINGLDAGSDDYLVKPIDITELLARIRVIERRLSVHKSNKLEFEGVRMDTAHHNVFFMDEEISLPRKEYLILRILLENVGRVLTRSQLESKLYSWGDEVASNAIEVHIHHIRKKFPNLLIKTMRGVGYVLKQQPK